jgi:hypothetical protein
MSQAQESSTELNVPPLRWTHGLSPLRWGWRC